MSVTKLVLKRPVSAFLLILAIVLFGFGSINSMPLEQMPDLEMPMQIVYTVYPGADAMNVEKLVTRPVEDAGETLSGVDSVTSNSMDNVSVVVFQYEYGIDIDQAYSDLKEKLDDLSHDLPANCQASRIMQMTLDASDTVTIAARGVGGTDILKYVEDTVVPELETMSGVASVEVSGGAADYVQVLLDEEKMSQYGLTISTVAQLVGASDFSIPAGSVSSGHMDVGVTAAAELDSLESLRNITLITGTGSLIHLSDVATVQIGSEKADSLSRHNGEETITISVVKKQTASTTKVCHDVEKVIAGLETASADFEIVYTAAESIENTIAQVFQTLIIGVICTMIVLMLFIGDIRASLIVGSSMPLSVLLAIIIINMMGFSLNVMTGGALIIAIGMIVDNSIVVLESCFRMRDRHLSYKEAAIEGAGTVGASVLASTITTVVVYLPMSMLEGMAGQMFEELGWTIIFTMLASLLSALSVVPLFFTRIKPVAKEELPINKLLAYLNQKYDGLARRVIHHRGKTILAAVVMLVAAVAAAFTLNMELIPSIYDGSISVSAEFRSGTKLERMDEMIRPIEEALLEDPNFETVNTTVSGSTATISAYSVKNCKRSSGDAVAYYTQMFEGLANMNITVTAQGAATSLSSIPMGTTSEIDLMGTDLDTLRQAAAMVEEACQGIPGIIKLNNDFAQSRTAAKIVVDPQRALAVGLIPAEVSQNIYLTLSGVEAIDVTMDGEEYTVKLEYPAERYDNIVNLMDKPMPTGFQDASKGYTPMVTLSEIADLTYTSDLQTISRQNGFYQIAITATTTTSAQFSAGSAMQAAVDKLELPAGVHQGTSMVNEIMYEELSGLFTAILIAVFLVFLVMAMQFESVRFSLMVMTCIPFSLVGSFLLMCICRTTLSMVSMMGLLMLMGIVVNNGILLVDTTNQLKEKMPLEDALVEAGRLRMRPILMTSLTTIMSMIPMLFQTDPTMKLMESLAMVIIGGLVASTVLAMFMMPAFYMLLTPKPKKQDMAPGDTPPSLPQQPEEG